MGTLNNCVIEHNVAASNGGGIQFISFAKPNITNCSIQFNNASSKGGGIQATNYCRPNISNTIISYNTATDGAGIAQNNYAGPTFDNVTIENNVAATLGGGILIEQSGRGEFINSFICSNLAKSGSGGGLLALDFANTTFTNCLFKSNTATATGAGIQISSSAHPAFYNCQMNTHLHNGTVGGAVVIIGTAYPLFDACLITDNHAETGAAFWIGKGTSPTIRQTTMQDNTASRGGAIYIQGGANPIIDTCTIKENTAIRGGGIFSETLALGIINATNFVSNLASESGGAGYLSCSSTVFDTTTFSNNTAINGGGLFMDVCLIFPSFTILQEVTFEKNEAINGGAIFLESNATTVGMAPQEIFGNNIESYTEDDESYTCTNCTFKRNSSVLGGAIYLADKNFKVNFGPTVTFTQNTATEIGAAIFITKVETIPASPWLVQAVFSNNEAEWAAGTVGFESLPSDITQADIDLFCDSCDFGTTNRAGYQTPDGFATPPSIATFDQGSTCPANVLLVDNTFSVGIILLDELGTAVHGPIFTNVTYSYNITLIYNPDTPCSFTTPTVISYMSDNGVAEFNNITLQGTQGNSCTLQFLPVDYPTIIPPVLPVMCSVVTEGCPTGNHQEAMDNTPFDTCTPNSGISWASTVALSILLLLILLLLIIVLCYCLFALHQRQKRKPDRFVGQLPDFDRSQQVTIFDILNDPQIPVIPWENIVKYERIGIGGSGMVWRGEQINTLKGESRPVALKQLLFGVDNISEKLVWEFLREIKLMSALRHENVVEFLGVSVSDTEEQELYLVTELMQNGSLSDLFTKKKFNMPWPLRLRLIQDAACGMAYLHSRNLIHRDLKSQNLLVNDQWICKIADFGISTIKPAAEKTMTCIGTPVYMAPEVIGNNKYSEKADIFSFGVLLVEAFSLKPPYSEPIFQNITQAQLMYQICHQNLRPPTDNLPLPLVQLVEDCWNENPELRPSFPEIIIRLHRLENLSLGEDSSFPHGETVPLRNAHTYTTFHEMIAPVDATVAGISINTDDDDPLIESYDDRTA